MTFSVHPAGPGQDGYVAENFYRMWREYALHTGLSRTWKAETLRFIALARERLEYAAFIAEAEGVAVGSAACQVFGGLYPSVFRQAERKYGYIWGVYVAPQCRGQGVAKALTEACTGHLKSVGCTRAVLHASPMGRSVYEKLGFELSNELKLEL